MKDDLEIGANIFLPAATKEMGDTEQTESKFILDLNARKPLMQRKNAHLMAKVGFGMESYNYDSGISGADEVKGSVIDLEFGVAEVVDLNEDNLLVAGITTFRLYSSGYENGDYESTLTNITLPAFNIGLESKIANWLVFRSGFEQAYYITTYEQDDGVNDSTETSYDNNFFYNMGLGFIFGNFTIDCVFNKDFLHKGPNFITGETTADIFGELLVEYKFK